MISSNGTNEDLRDVKHNKEQHRTTSASPSCPSCGHKLDHCNLNLVGFPAGVRFDPSDQELIEHLESLVKDGGSRAHPLINDFIPTIQGDDGICYAHPENLPGVTRDGLSKHFFHRPSKAYPTGTRKRRKILSEHGQRSSGDVGEARWHKTGKTRPLIVGGQQRGCKKILVLYTNYGKQGKPEKTNWVMHQYHLGMSEDEKDGELVVSKVFYQTQLRSAATIIEQNYEKVEVTPEATSNILSFSSTASTAAAVTMVELQQHQKQGQAHGHGQCRFSPAKLFQEVGADDTVSIHQGQLHGNHHVPSQHHVQPFNTKPDTSMPFVVTKALNTELTDVSPAVQHASALLTNGFHSPAILLRNKNQQDQQWRRQKDDSRKSCTLGEAMIACQAVTEEDDASIRPNEIQRPYQCWPPDDH